MFDVLVTDLAQAAGGRDVDAAIRATPDLQWCALLGSGVQVVGDHPNLTIVHTAPSEVRVVLATTQIDLAPCESTVIDLSDEFRSGPGVRAMIETALA